ncbi:hypothetical protein FQR65_LT07779 [Abscondita terminalis]|nr:hypothetical protein FQR65_LT07779 [Abscondita terminalis]
MKSVILFLCCFSAIYAWTSLETVTVDPNNPDVCISKDPVVGTMKVGEKKTVDGRCVRAICGVELFHMQVVYGGISGERVPVDPDNPDVCVSKDPGVGVMKVGETKTIQGRCVRASCGKGGLNTQVVYSWTSIEPLTYDPNNPGKCVSKDPVVGTMKVGEIKTVEGRCVRATCGSGQISYAGCGVISGPEGCKEGPEDLSKPYPDCCPKIICPKT